MRTFEGLASTPAVDHRWNIVVPEGMCCDGVVPIQFAHEGVRIGRATHLEVSHGGILVRAELDDSEMADWVWQQVKSGAARALSIGYDWLRRSPIPGGGTRYDEWILQEISICRSGGNPLATITRFYS